MSILRQVLLGATALAAVSTGADAAIDLIYRTPGGAWWARTYQQGGITPGGVQVAPEFNLFGSNSDHLNFGQVNNDAGGLIDNIYGDLGGGLYWNRTWTPASPQPGPAAATPAGDSNTTPGFGFTGSGGFRATKIGDYNNDGQSDFFYQEGSAGGWYGRTYAPASPQPGPNGTQTTPTEIGMPISANPFHIADWNNDGLNDLITIDGSDRWRADTYTQGVGETGIQGHANGPAPIVLNSASSRPLIIADVNNDGLKDLIYRYEGNNTWYRQTYLPDTSTVADLADGIQVGAETALVNSDNILIGDYNNDGLNDLLTVVGSTWRAFTVLPTNDIGSAFDLELSSGNDIRFLVNFNNSGPIPEPAALSLLGLGALALRRRK